MDKNQEYACVYDWEDRGDHVGTATTSLVGGREGADRAGDVCARHIGVVGSAPARYRPNQLFSWRRLYAEGALSAVSAVEEVVPASDYRALQHQVRELQRLLGKKTLENEVLA